MTPQHPSIGLLLALLPKTLRQPARQARFLAAGLGLVAAGLMSCSSADSDSGASGGASGNLGTGGTSPGQSGVPSTLGGSSSGGGTASPGTGTGGSAAVVTTGGGSGGVTTVASGGISSGGSHSSGGVSAFVSGGSASGGSGSTVVSGGTSSGGSGPSPTTGGTTSSGGRWGTGTGGFLEASGGSSSSGGSDGPRSGGADGAGETGSGGISGPTSGGGTGLETGGSGDGGASAQVTCSIDVTAQSMSAEIPTVGIVEWATDLPGVTEASIEFGLDTNYGMTAPVDLNEANFRTVLLGMKAGGRTYHFRVVAKAGGQICTGEDNTLPPTGDPPNSLPQLSLTPAQAEGLDGGFMVLETFQQAFGVSGDGAAYIIDGDGDFVWWYVVRGIADLSRTRQSYDGKYMWITTVNAMRNTQKMIRVKMDGSDVQDLTQEFGNTHHDFAVRSDETIAFMTYGASGCDEINERSPDGIVTTIVNSADVLGSSACHCNAIHYDRNDDTILFSELTTSSIAKVTRDTKQVIWVMSSQNPGKATVSGISWTNQHGMHIIDEEHLLFFNNNTGPNSAAIEAELSINGGSGTASELWSYHSNVTVQYMGDAQRLSNGNSLLTFSTGGEIREVSPSGTVLQTIKVSGSGNLIGFSEKRRSLYGPPPR